MTRIYESAAYAPQPGCWWSDTDTVRVWPKLVGSSRTQVAIIGAGFTGLSAARLLTAEGIDVTVLDAQSPGFGASGRNGGFCCLGGAMASGNQIARLVGTDGLAEWRSTEVAAIDTVDRFLTDTGASVDRYSEGETQLAHSPGAWARMLAEVPQTEEAYGVRVHVTERDALQQEGLAGPFHGATTIPLGFALNPRKYHSALVDACRNARIFGHSPVEKIARQNDGWLLQTEAGSVRADKVIVATNGYASDDLPEWMRARYLPVQSSVLVTRPLTQDERAMQGWTSLQMAYDARFLLHYFRLMPDRRFLFGMRGGLRATPRANARVEHNLRADFHAMFPAWKDVEITHLWQGLVCLTAQLHPFCGPVPDMPGVFAGFGYHGNGVAMASHTGTLLAGLVAGQDTGVPRLMQRPPRRFPLGRFRRALLAPTYAAARLLDR